ncbi:MAG: GNAT family N-acetyltransferase [Cyanobacteria bacterium P01_E01_bin.35]
MKIATLDVNNFSWLETLSKLPHDVYHLPEYVALDAQRTQTIPEAFLLEDDEKIFFAPYLLRSCSDVINCSANEIYDVISPYGYPGILMSDAAINNPEFPDFALQKFRQTLQARGVCSAFLRLHPILGEQFAKVFTSDPLKENGQTVSIDLTLDEDKIWAKTRRGHQSTINKCIRLGLTARTVSLDAYLDEFIAIYEETMNRVQAQDSYYFSRDYFTGLLKLGDRVHLGVVELADKIVCACIFFESCGIVQAHLGGTRTEFLKQSPFNLLLHQMRLWAKERGNQYLHIGGGVGGKKDNLYTFKSGFSKQRHNFFTLRSVIDSARYDDLVQFRAKSINKSVEELEESQFFPAYRAV